MSKGILLNFDTICKSRAYLALCQTYTMELFSGTGPLTIFAKDYYQRFLQGSNEASASKDRK